MISPDTLYSSAAFIAFVATDVMAFIFLVKNISKLTISFCALHTINFILWSLHGYTEHDLALTCGAGFGTLSSLIILGNCIYYKATSR